MHQCLRIPEIAQLIRDHISDDEGYKKPTRPQQLLALALTCREFQYSALECLWESIRSIYPIIKCAGRDMWRMDKQVLYLSRDILPSDLATMKKYANMVRNFGVAEEPYDCNDAVSPSVWLSLQSALEDAPLFLNIRNMYIHHEDRTFAALFGTQNLNTLIVDLSHYDSSIMQPPALIELAARSSGLTSMILKGLGVYNLEVLRNLSNLSHLTMAWGTTWILRAVSRYCHSLRFLRFDCFELWSSDDPQLLSPELEQFEIGFEDTLHATKFLMYFPVSDSIQSLTVSLHTRLGAFHYAPNSQLSLSLKRHARYLRKLNLIQQKIPFDHDVPQYEYVFLGILDGDLAGLTHINILNNRGYTITDGDIKHLTEALPLLEEFHMLTRDPPDNRWIWFGATIACLAIFAQNCPSLSRLSLAFDARVYGKLLAKILDFQYYLRVCSHCGPAIIPVPKWGSEIPSFPASTSQSLNSISLDVSVSCLKDPQAVASYIFNTFPNISGIRWTNGGDTGWEKVFKCLKSHTKGKIRKI